MKRLALIFAVCVTIASVGIAETSFVDVSLVLPRAEFAKYHELITGRRPEADVLRLAVDPSVSKSGNDAYKIVSEDDGVAITGSNLRSVFYGVYDLLGRRGGCRWFWDGDVVPKKEALDLSGLDIHEESQFEFRAIRYFAHRGLKRFQAEHWGPDDWKKEIDWCLKRRLNTFMLRIGQDDLFQRAFPDVVSYPDPSKNLPGQGHGYDNRSLFWSLQYRGRLRQFVQRYGRERGMMIPEDFGTMSHWYSRTPDEFLEKMKPDFVPQASSTYGEKSGLVWDIRQDRWLDAYWRLTETAIRDFGSPDLLHTIGLGERKCYMDRAENFRFKEYALDRIFKKAAKSCPDSRLLLAGWDFYHSWTDSEVRALLPSLDPKRVVIWDYEADAYARSNFTQWDVVGKFPYTFGIFLTLEQGLDVRANYSVIEERERIIASDPFCKGYIFWPESSHTDSLLMEYFAKNSWRALTVTHDMLIPVFCRDRYGQDAERMAVAWKATVPISTVSPDLWSRNYGKHSYHLAEEVAAIKLDIVWTNGLGHIFKDAPETLRLLAEIDSADEFVRRDIIDLARTIVDRMLIAEQAIAMSGFKGWCNGSENVECVKKSARCWRELADAMADLLSLHVDYSLYDTYLSLDRVEKIQNPDFQHVLVENALNSYCASHQAELARHVWYPIVRDWTDSAIDRMEKGERQAISLFMRADYLTKAKEADLKVLNETLPISGKSLPCVLSRMADAADIFVESAP